jgi:hypothetical protein
MPVSYLPLILTGLLIAAPALALMKGKKAFLLALAASIIVVLVVMLPVYVSGWLLAAKAYQGDRVAQYELARWYATHCEKIQELLLVPCQSDSLMEYSWLEKAASQDYVPAVYALVVMLKHGIAVPRPENWKGPEGNVFPQPERGQPLIDRALRMGYKPIVPEQQFYSRVFRR